MEPVVSIVLPTYERPALTRLAITSALRQSFGEFRLLVGDDSSTDAVEAVVREFDDPRISYRRNTPRRGPAANWTELIRSATTPFVASLNDDDEWEPTFLERLVPPMLSDDHISLAFGDYWLIDEHGRQLVELTDELSRRTRRDRLERGVLTTSIDDRIRVVAAWNAPQPAICAVMRTAAVQHITVPAEVSSIHDLWFSYQLALQGGDFYFVPERLTRYRWHSESLTQTVGFDDEEDHVFAEVVRTEGLTPSVAAEVRRYWASIRWGRAVRLMSRDDSDAERRSRDELRRAKADLSGPRRVAAELGSRSSIAWRVGALLRRRRRSAA